MRIALLADVHANHVALDEVIRDACAPQSVDEFWFLGDLVGYGPNPTLCLEMMMGLPIPEGAFLVGNHDLATRAKLQGESTRGLVRDPSDLAVIDLHVRRLLSLYRGNDPQLNKWLNYPTWGRPMTYPRAVLSHARLVSTSKHSIENAKDLVLSRVDAEVSLQTGIHATGCCPALFLVGHSHVPKLSRRHDARPDARDDLWEELPIRFNPLNGPFELGDWDKSPVLINPGSVGQPRDGIPCAAYAILDLNRQTVEFRRVSYDIRGVQRQMEGEGIVDVLRYRLWRGW